ncbi:MAG: UDP-N-acetylmuramoyl-tripeptide--D-alanyl-D-alanine ligase [Candidatus Omnitrophica bacterium]|nr:UDP-N-acetylmuramoyl-tripeptide--D-alanyl-D-alanine ligase [Candidatus Omnitrophota bacterium]
MRSFTIQELLKATEGQLLHRGASESFRGISIDTRTLQEGDLFIAIKGKRFEGHDFVEEAVRRGASGVLVSKKVTPLSPKVALLVVPDTLAALGAIASYHRKQFSIPVIAVTGSNGKTTTKEMISHLLSSLGPVLKNEGTKNNRIGVPLTLLSLERDHQFAVLELGMSEPGEIGILSRMAAPSTALVTNIGPVHLALLKELGTVFACKMEILEGLEKGGTLVLNGEDPYLKEVRSPSHRVVFFGKGSPLSVSGIEQREEGIFFRCEDLQGFLPLLGEQNVENALAAIAVADLQGMSPSLSIQRLKSFRGLEGRMRPKRTGGIEWIDDTYNANPESMRRAVESLKGLSATGRRVLIMGDMLELGEKAQAYHETVGEKVATSNIDLFVTVGPLSRFAHEKAKSLGMNGQRSAHFSTTHEAAQYLAETTKQGDRILIKGSRGMKMEEVIIAVSSALSS